MVGLETPHRHPQLLGTSTDLLMNLFQRHCAIDSRLACSQLVQIGTAQYQEIGHAYASSPAKNACKTGTTSSSANGVLTTSPMRVGIIQRTRLPTTFLSNCMVARIAAARTGP